MKKHVKELILSLKSRHVRKKSNFFLLEGERACFEVFSIKDFSIQEVVCLEKYVDRIPNHLAVSIVSMDFFLKCSFTDSPQGIILLMQKKIFPTPSYKGIYQVVLDRIQDPGNMGTILRTCLALGVEEIILTKGCVDLYNPKVLRSSLGSIFSLNITLGGTLEDITGGKGDGIVWLSSPKGGVSCYSDKFHLGNSMLVFGNEANGIGSFAKGELLSIPMPGDFESLNVAQAATVILFEGVKKLGFFDEL